ncbi:MAG: BREX-3 system P-loop-containing protein BrxF [Desulfosudaceae bacterium]
MAGSMHVKAKHSLDAAQNLYCRLVLLVGKTGSGKTEVLQTLTGECNTEVTNVNLLLSARLLELTPRKRAIRVPEILREIVETQSTPVLLDNLEILFEKELRQDPLRLLLGISRNHLMAASWNGTAEGGKLTYAEPGHPEYRRYDSIDPLIVKMDGSATIDKAANNKKADE